MGDAGEILSWMRGGDWPAQFGFCYLKSMIYLIRHARPLFDTSQKVVDGQLAHLIKGYDRAGIVSPVPPLPLDTVAKVFSSDTPRAERSARAFFPSVEPDISEVFREAQLPKSLSFTTGLRFHVAIAIARCLWLCGYAPDGESFGEAKQRADIAAILLKDAVAIHGTVALVGHGFFNRLIGKSLARSGWKLASSPGSGFGAIRGYRRMGE